MIRIGNPDNSSHNGTGSYIGNGYVLTCAHLFGPRYTKITTGFPNDGLIQAKLVKIDRLNDMALLKINRKVFAQPIEIYSGDVEPGIEGVSAGYGGTIKRAWRKRTVTQYLAPGDSKSFTWLDSTGSARDGDSGGPLLSKDGKLLGLICAGDSRSSGGPRAGPIRRFLGSILGRRRPPVKPRPQPPLVDVPSRPAPEPTEPPPVAPNPRPVQHTHKDLEKLIRANTEALTAISQQIAQINTILADIEAKPGPPGPKGDTGPPGPPGRDATEAVIDIKDLASKLPPIRVMWVDENGKPIPGVTPIDVRLGQTMPLKLITRKD